VLNGPIVATRERLSRIAEWADAGVLKPYVERIYAFEDAPSMYAASQRGHGAASGAGGGGQSQRATLPHLQRPKVFPAHARGIRRRSWPEPRVRAQPARQHPGLLEDRVAIAQKCELMRLNSLMMSRCSELVSIDLGRLPGERSKWVPA
jgi:hypothetical protein